MGHYEEVLTGKGKNKQEALGNALQEFWHENGHDYSISKHLGAQWIAVELPEQWTQRTATVKRMNRYGRYTTEQDVVMERLPAWGTPTRQWLQVWEFTIDFHH